MALRRRAKSKIGEARFGKCRLTITPPEFIKGVCKRRIFRRKKLVGEDPLDPLSRGGGDMCTIDKAKDNDNNGFNDEIKR